MASVGFPVFSKFAFDHLEELVVLLGFTRAGAISHPIQLGSGISLQIVVYLVQWRPAPDVYSVYVSCNGWLFVTWFVSVSLKDLYQPTNQ